MPSATMTEADAARNVRSHGAGWKHLGRCRTACAWVAI